MTTIAYDGVILSGDGRITTESAIITDTAVKVYSISRLGATYAEDRLIAVGVAGTLAHFDTTVAMIVSGDYKDDQDVSSIIVGVKWVYELEPESDRWCRYTKSTQLAVGSGAPYALSAMRLGKTAKEAVKHAMTCDCYSGGKITTLRCSV